MTPKQQIDEFLAGVQDAKDGIRHTSGKGENYDRGYSAQYGLDQIKNERTANHD